MASGRIFRVRLNLLTLFDDSGHVAMCCWVKSCGLPQDGHARPTNSTVLLDCAYRANQCSRGQKWSHLLGPKLFVLSLIKKMLLDVACQLVYSWFHSSKTDDIMEFLLLLILQHRRKKPLPYHVIYMCNTNLIYREGGGTLKKYKFIMHKQEVQYRILVGIVARWARTATQSVTLVTCYLPSRNLLFCGY